MTNIFYQLPIRVLNIIVGLGTGTTEYDCTVCSTYYEKGSATQWYTSFGISIISPLEIHLSYRSVTAKNIKNKYTDKTAVIVAPGPSLKNYDKDKLKETLGRDDIVVFSIKQAYWWSEEHTD